MRTLLNEKEREGSSGGEAVVAAGGYVGVAVPGREKSGARHPLTRPLRGVEGAVWAARVHVSGHQVFSFRRVVDPERYKVRCTARHLGGCMAASEIVVRPAGNPVDQRFGDVIE
jgi:hypothetical protein